MVGFLCRVSCSVRLDHATSQRGMEGMDGPINFGENDRYWGLLVEGFQQPTFQMYHHVPYYRKLFENYGFQVYFEQTSNEMDITKPLPERFEKIARWVMNKEGIEFKHGSWKDRWTFVKVLQEVYNDAWQHFENFTPLQEEQLRRLMKEREGESLEILRGWMEDDEEEKV